MQELSVETVLAGLSDEERGELFGGLDAVKKMREAERLQGEARRRIAQAMAAIAGTADGMCLLDYLVGAYIRRFNNVTGLALPMETAIQLHAERDGQKEVVYDLLRLVNEGRKAT